jgi:hypothetical protein
LSRPYSRKGTRSFGEELGPKPKKRALENVCTKLQKAEKTLKKPRNDHESIFQYSKPKKNEKVYRDYETTGEKLFSPTGEKNGRSRAGKKFFYYKK